MRSRGCCAPPSASTGSATQAARDRLRDQVPDADAEDLLLLDDLLGIGDPVCSAPRSIRMLAGVG